MIPSVAYLSVFTGVVPLYFYYLGLRLIPASHVTVIELVYPFSAAILNTLVLNLPLSPVQWIAGVILMGSITVVSIQHSRR